MWPYLKHMLKTYWTTLAAVHHHMIIDVKGWSHCLEGFYSCKALLNHICTSLGRCTVYEVLVSFIVSFFYHLTVMSCVMNKNYELEIQYRFGV